MTPIPASFSPQPSWITQCRGLLDMPGVAIAGYAVPTGQNPLGVKGAGEAGTVGALSSIISAVSDALRPFGINHIDMPATPARVWRCLEMQRKEKLER